MQPPKLAEPKPSERFVAAMRKIVSVPKAELIRREEQYQRKKMTENEELDLRHTVEKTDEDPTELAKRVSKLEKQLEKQAAEIGKLRSEAEAELKRHWCSLMNLVDALKTLPGWLDMKLVENRMRKAVDSHKRFEKWLIAAKDAFDR